MAAPRPRTLTDAVRALTPEQLALALERRPDLLDPTPQSLTELVNRAISEQSVGSALSGLTHFQQLIGEGIATLPGPDSSSLRDGRLRTLAELAELVGQPVDRVRAAVSDLRALLLVWGDDDELRLVRTARTAFGDHPGGLAPPSAVPLGEAEIAVLVRAVEQLDPPAQTLLARLAWAPLIPRPRPGAGPGSSPEYAGAVQALLGAGLLRPTDADKLVLPREVAWALRGGRLSRDEIPPVPPTITGTPHPMERVDRIAVGAAYELLHDLDLLAHTLQVGTDGSGGGHRLVRTGGLATRDLTALTRALRVSPVRTAFLIELAAAAELIGATPDLRVLPTPVLDAWLDLPPAGRWRRVADAWLGARRLLLQAAEPGVHVLGPVPASALAPDLRAVIFGRPGRYGRAGLLVPGLEPDTAALAAAFRWTLPAAEALTQQPLPTILDWLRQEAAWLGLTGVGALSSLGVAVGNGSPLPADVRDRFPLPVDRIIVQADLTAVAPGPLPAPLLREVRLLADQESHGGAGVFRFTAASLRRAYDAGWDAEGILAWLERHSSTAVPQPLGYLVEDVGRGVGAVRVGTAGCYVRCSDPAVVAAVLARPESADLGVRQIAPGVLVADAEAADLVELLRAAGQHPGVEDAAGDLLTAPPAPRAPAPPRRRRHDPDTVAARLLATSAIPSRASSAAAPGAPTTASRRGDVDDVLLRLGDAAQARRPVTVRSVAADGAPVETDLTPVEIAGGTVRGHDAGGRRIALPLGRVLAVTSGPGGSKRRIGRDTPVE